MATTTTRRMITGVIFTLIISAFTTGLPIIERSDVSDRSSDSSPEVRDDPAVATETMANGDPEMAMANADLLSGNPALANAGLFNGNPAMANAGFLSGNPAMANAGLLSGNPAMANAGLLSGNPAMANAGLLSGNPAMANAGLLSGNPAMANAGLLSGNPAMANAGLLSGNPAMANAGLISGNPAMANAGLLSGNPAMANAGLLSGNPAMANAGLLSGNPAMANADLLSGNPAMANADLLSGNPAMANAGLLSGDPAMANHHLFNDDPRRPAAGPMMNAPDDPDHLDQFMIEGPDGYEHHMDVFDIRAMRGQCPMVDCMMVHMMLPCPDSDREPAMFTINGMLCKGCLRCKERSGEENDGENVLPDLPREPLSLTGGRDTEPPRDANVISVTPEDGGIREGYQKKDDVSKTASHKKPETDSEQHPGEVADAQGESSRDTDPERSESRDAEIPKLVVGAEPEPETKGSSKSAAVTSSPSEPEAKHDRVDEWTSDPERFSSTTEASIELVLK